MVGYVYGSCFGLKLVEYKEVYIDVREYKNILYLKYMVVKNLKGLLKKGFFVYRFNVLFRNLIGIYIYMYINMCLKNEFLLV